MCRFDMCTVSGIGWCWAVIAAVAVGLLGYWLGRLHRRDGGPSQKGKAAFSAKSGKTETAALSGVPARIEHPFEELPRLSVEGTWQVRLECNAPENRAAFEAYSAEMAYWRAKREEREREEAKAQ